jgi:hypothetical protein
MKLTDLKISKTKLTERPQKLNDGNGSCVMNCQIGSGSVAVLKPMYSLNAGYIARFIKLR